jgi:hypothetical protein
MMDYTNQQNAPLERNELVAPWANEDRAIALRTRTDEKYQREFGERTVHVHLLPRMAERTQPGWTLQPRRWQYVQQYGNDVTVFASEPEPGAEPQWDGWLYHHEIRKRAKRIKNGSYIVNHPLRDMESFGT